LENKMKIGIAGLGRMGAAIAKRLKSVGHEVTVWNRTAAKSSEFEGEGFVVAATPAALAAQVDAVITILTNDEAIAAVYDGQSGLLSGDVAGKLFIEMSTVQPKTEIALAKRVTSNGAHFVECPVGGTVGPALQGKLIGLAGGDPADFERARPILDQLCRRVDLCGAAGAGSSMKLAINLPLAVFWQSMGEAFALCSHLGKDTQWLVELFADSSGGPNVIRARGGAVALALSDKDAGSATFDCDSIRKDLRTMIAEAKDLGIRLPLTEQTLAVYDQASVAGWGGRDGVELPRYWSKSVKPL
jgi:3-hydroxyisobutyrate dehydrogenase